HVVAVIAHERGQVEGDGEPLAAVREKIFVALVGFLRRGEARELAHGPHFAAVSAGVYAAGVRRLAGIIQVVVVAPVGGKVGLGVEATDRHAGNGGETRIAVRVEVDARGRADGLLGR